MTFTIILWVLGGLGIVRAILQFACNPIAVKMRPDLVNKAVTRNLLFSGAMFLWAAYRMWG